MPIRSDAEEHLRIIRSLMEKATIYRAISAEAAAVGGVLAIVASFAFGNIFRDGISGNVDHWLFMALWLGVLVLAGLSNAIFLYRSAQRRQERFISSGMRVALRALAPAFLVAGFFTIFLGEFYSGNLANLIAFEWIVPIWITCYGVALLATTHFAPRSLEWLGWAFLTAGLIAFTQVAAARFQVIELAAAQFQALGAVGFYPIESTHLDRFALSSCQRWMAGTFGLFHLIYAACTWPRRTRGTDAGGTP